MDPDECLKQIRQALLLMGEAESDAAYMTAASDLFNAVEAMDAWMSKGGFMPTAWWSAKIKVIRNEVTGAS